jgi:hypothetical protein
MHQTATRSAKLYDDWQRLAVVLQALNAAVSHEQFAFTLKVRIY